MWRRRPRLLGALVAFLYAFALLSLLSAAGAVTLPPLPIIGGSGGNGLNDLAAAGQGFGQTPATVPTVHRTEPPLTATPLANCGPGSRPQPDVDGRVPAGSSSYQT